MILLPVIIVSAPSEVVLSSKLIPPSEVILCLKVLLVFEVSQVFYCKCNQYILLEPFFKPMLRTEFLSSWTKGMKLIFQNTHNTLEDH